MARGRMIDKVIILSKKLNAVSEGAENLYYRIYVNTDDFGIFHADPKILKGQIYTLRRISVTAIEKRLNELIDIILVKIFINNGEEYLEIVDFKKHQTFRKDYKRKHEYPTPSADSYKSVRNRTESPTKLNQDNTKESNSKEGQKYDTLFKEFWNTYKYKVGKDVAKEKFMILARDGLIPDLIKATHGYIDYLKHQKIHKNFDQEKMHPKTFLTKNRWKDYIDFKYEPPL